MGRQPVPAARSTAEARYAVSLEACSSCGTRTPPRLDFYSDREMCVMTGKCPQCGIVRRVDFTSPVDPIKLEHDRLELGGPEPSELIPQASFAAELERLQPQLVADPRTIGVDEWLDAGHITDRAVIAARELCKFPTVDARHIAERDRLNDRADQFRADAPRIWIIKGNGKLTLESEIRGVLNQITRKHVPTPADIEAYLAARGTAQSDVESVQASIEDGHTKVEFTVTKGTLKDVKAAVFPKGLDTAVIEGHPVRIEVDMDGTAVRRVTLTL